MKKILLLIILLFISGTLATAGTPVNTEKIDTFHTTWRFSFVQPTIFFNGTELTARHRIGLLMGLDFHIPILKTAIHQYDGLALETGIQALFSANADPEAGTFGFHIPLLVKYHIFKKNNYGVNIQLGPTFDFLLLDMEDWPPGLEKLSANFAIGFGFNIGSTLIDFRWEWGLSSYLKGADRKMNRFYVGFSI